MRRSCRDLVLLSLVDSSCFSFAIGCSGKVPLMVKGLLLLVSRVQLPPHSLGFVSNTLSQDCKYARGQGTDPWMPGMKSLEDPVTPDRLWPELTRRRSDVGTICCLLWPEYPAEYNIVTEQNISSGSVLQAVIRILLTVCQPGAWPILSILLWLFWKFERLSAVSLGQLMDTRSLTFGNVSILVLTPQTQRLYFYPCPRIFFLKASRHSVCPENELNTCYLQHSLCELPD